MSKRRDKIQTEKTARKEEMRQGRKNVSKYRAKTGGCPSAKTAKNRGISGIGHSPFRVVETEELIEIEARFESEVKDEI